MKPINLMLSVTLMTNANGLHFIQPLSYLKCRMSLQMLRNNHKNCIQFLIATEKVSARHSDSLQMEVTKNKRDLFTNFISHQMLLKRNARLHGVHSYLFAFLHLLLLHLLLFGFNKNSQSKP